MADNSSTPLPWTGNFNVRGASLTFTNIENVAYVYHFCLIDFPANARINDSMNPFNLVSVTQIDNPGTFNYNPGVKYTAADRSLVYYNGMYYTCIANTSGDFDPSCWQAAGTESYQLNYVYNDEGDGWPQADADATTVTYALPIFTTLAGYDPSKGPIVNMIVSLASDNTSIQTGDPNRGKPPVVNLPLNRDPNMNSLTPVPVIFASETYPTGWNTWILVCVNSGKPGYANKFSLNPAGNGLYAGSFVSNSQQSSQVAAVGIINADNEVAVTGYTLNGGNPFPIANPLSKNAYYYEL